MFICFKILIFNKIRQFHYFLDENEHNLDGTPEVEVEIIEIEKILQKDCEFLENPTQILPNHCLVSIDVFVFYKKNIGEFICLLDKSNFRSLKTSSKKI